MVNVLVTGGNGFIGGRLLRQLVSNTRTGNIYAVTRKGSANAHLPESLRISQVVYDGTADSLKEAVADSDYIIHLGALYSTRQDDTTADALIASNISFTVHLLQAAAAVNPDASIVSTSTFSAYDGDYRYAPQSLYAATKKAVEVLAAAYPLRTSFLRLPDTYGPGDWRAKVHNLLRKAVTDREVSFSFQKPQEQVVNLAHVDDVITALIHVAQLRRHTEPGVQVYDLFYPSNDVSLGELAQLIIEGSNTAVAFPLFGATSPLPPFQNGVPGFTPTHNVRDSIKTALFGEDD